MITLNIQVFLQYHKACFIYNKYAIFGDSGLIKIMKKVFRYCKSLVWTILKGVMIPVKVLKIGEVVKINSSNAVRDCAWIHFYVRNVEAKQLHGYQVFG
jgi:hypothetical protein